MRIGVTSQNKLKVSAVQEAYRAYNPIVTEYTTDSMVGEQPVGEQTIVGARNRILDVASRVTGLDRIVSIESGIFLENEQWHDRAVIMIYSTHSKTTNYDYSASVIFPNHYVQRAQQVGFATTTVGSIMAQDGFIENAKDPHYSITGIPRKQFILDTLRRMVHRSEF